MHPTLTIETFDYSDKHFNLLVNLRDRLCHQIKNWRTPEMLRYELALIPEKCRHQLDFIMHEGSIIGFGVTTHDHNSFDPNLLFSTLVVPNDDKYLDCAKRYLDCQIDRARQLKVKVFHSWSSKGTDWVKNFYLANGFGVSLVEYVSTADLDHFFMHNFEDATSGFAQNHYEIVRLHHLKRTQVDWETKLFELWRKIEQDVPDDHNVKLEFNMWKRSVLHPWFREEDVYIVLDGDSWVALSSYSRSTKPHDVIDTELTGVRPEYRRQGICTALKIFALEDIKQKGFKKVLTSNEQNNPMYQINLKLGFQQIGFELGCKLSF